MCAYATKDTRIILTWHLKKTRYKNEGNIKSVLPMCHRDKKKNGRVNTDDDSLQFLKICIDAAKWLW